MSYALHRGFEQTRVDTVGEFPQAAQECLHLEELVEAFARVIVRYHGIGHYCYAIDEDGVWLPLCGDTPALTKAGHGDRIEIIHADTAGGEQLAILIALSTDADRQRLSTLRLLSTLYATHAITLVEAHDELLHDGQITPIEEQCVSLALAGLSNLDIGEQLDRSATAVGIHIRRATAKLAVSSVAEACAIMASSGLMSEHLPVGPAS